MSNVVETVKRIVSEVAQPVPGAQIIAPLMVWDGEAGAMGVQIKAPQLRREQRCEVTAGFVLSRSELSNEHMIRAKAKIAVAAVVHDVQVHIRPFEAVSPERERELLEAASMRAV